MKRFALLLSLILVGCQVPSTVALRGSGGRNAFNTTLQMTSNEQLLLNLIRLRYCDTPFFLNVTNITNQVAVETKGGLKMVMPGFNQDNPSNIDGAVSWRSQPTIVYTPIEGRQFSELLLKPIDLLFIQQLVYSGWDIDRVFKLSVQSFDNIYNAPTASGPFPNISPIYKDFYRVVELMHYFQKRNELHIGIKGDTNHTDQVDLSEGIQIFFPNNGDESKELATLLGDVQPKEGYYMIDMRLGFQKEGRVGIMPRSVLSCMYYLSLGVEVPEKHDQGMTITTVNDCDCEEQWKKVINELLVVRHSKSKPKDAYCSVEYRGHWFYIENDDISSKRTFALLLNLYNLQAGSTKGRAPVLTIPVGV